MDDQTEDRGPSVHGQFILDVNLSGQLPANDAEAFGRAVAYSLAKSLTELFEKAPHLPCSLKGTVLCGWRVWGPDGEAALSCDYIQLSHVPTRGDAAAVDRFRVECEGLLSEL